MTGQYSVSSNVSTSTVGAPCRNVLDECHTNVNSSAVATSAGRPLDVISTSYSSESNISSLDDDTVLSEFASHYRFSFHERSPALHRNRRSNARPTTRNLGSEDDDKNTDPQIVLLPDAPCPFPPHLHVPIADRSSTPTISSSELCSDFKLVEPSCSPSDAPGQPTPSNQAVPRKRRARKQLMAGHRRRVLLRMLQNYASPWPVTGSVNIFHSNRDNLAVQSDNLVDGSFFSLPGGAQQRVEPAFWAEILPVCVAGYLDLLSVTRLRQACTRLYYRRKYVVANCNFERWCTLTEQEFIGKVLPQLKKFLTAGSLSQLNFSHCCLLTDSFPKSLTVSSSSSLCRNLRALYFDFCYALTDKSLEVLLSTPLPHLESLSLRCARSRDLTGAPFSSKDLLSKTRWPHFHQLSCSCTQVTLPHLDSVALFLAERAVELSVAPKLGISGSLASNSLIRRLGLEEAHHTFIEAIVNSGTVEAAKKAEADFEAQWSKAMDDPEHRSKVLHRLVRHRGAAILVNAPCSVAVVDDGEGHEKAVWSLLGRRRSTVHTLPAGLTAGSLEGSCAGTPVSCTPAKYTGGHVSFLHHEDNVQACALCRQHHCTERPLCLPLTPENNITSEARPALSVPSATSAASSPYYPVSSSNPSGGPIQAKCVDTIAVNATSCVGGDVIAVSSLPGPIATESADSVGTATEAAYKHVHYSRWSYPLPIAIRLGNLPMIEYLLKRGTYVDIWGYNFATPLYIAASHARSNGSPAAPYELPSSDSSQLLLQQLPLLDNRCREETTSEAESPLSDITSAPQTQQETSAIGSAAENHVDAILHTSATADACTGQPVEYNVVMGDPQEFGPSPLTTAPQIVLLPTRQPRCTCFCHHTLERHGQLQDTSTYKESAPAVATSLKTSPLSAENTAVSVATMDHCSHKDTTSMKIVELLLQYRAPVDAPDLYSVKCPVNAAIKNDNKELLEIFLAHGATINVRALPQHVISPLIQVSRRQQQKKQPQKGLTRLGYKSPLFVACELHAWRCVSVLLDHGADPHWRDPFSNRNLTPTLLAYRKNPAMLQLFVAKGAGNTRETRWVLSEVMAAAILQDDIPTIRFLATLYPDLSERESGGMWSLPLIQASRLNKVAVVEELLKLGSDPNTVNPEGLTSLHFAASEGHKSVIELLLISGAKPNVIGGPQLKTPLHIAVEENRRDVVETLLKFGADMTIKNEAGVTPFMSSISSRNDKVAMLLIQRGTVAELDVTDPANRTALTYAIYFGQFKVADALVEKGVSLRLVDMSGQSTESILKEKIQALGKTTSTSTLNKFFRNIVGAAAGTSSSSSQANTSAGHPRKDGQLDGIGAPLSAAVADKAEAGQNSDESVRKLNAKRKKVAKQLLNKIRAKAKKHTTPAPTVSIQASEKTAAPSPALPARNTDMTAQHTNLHLHSPASSYSHESAALLENCHPVPPPVTVTVVTPATILSTAAPPAPTKTTVLTDPAPSHKSDAFSSDAVTSHRSSEVTELLETASPMHDASAVPLERNDSTNPFFSAVCRVAPEADPFVASHQSSGALSYDTLPPAIHASSDTATESEAHGGVLSGNASCQTSLQSFSTDSDATPRLLS